MFERNSLRYRLQIEWTHKNVATDSFKGFKEVFELHEGFQQQVIKMFVGYK